MTEPKSTGRISAKPQQFNSNIKNIKNAICHGKLAGGP
jgi:hypothetical protein